MSALKKLVLIDDDQNISYNLLVSPEDFEKASANSDYAAVLLVEAIETGKNVHISKFVKEVPNVEELAASSAYRDDAIPSTSSACSQEKVEDLTQPSNKENVSNLDNDSSHTWTEENTFLLINCYREEGVNFLVHKNDISAALQRVYVKMNNNLVKHGKKTITYKKCISKLDQLKRTYKENLDLAKQSGSGAIKWPYFEVMHEIFNKEAWAKPLSTAGSNVQGKLEISTLSTGLKRPNMSASFDEWVIERKLKKETDALRHQEKMARMDRLNDSLVSMAQNFNILVDAKIKKMESKDNQKKD